MSLALNRKSVFGCFAALLAFSPVCVLAALGGGVDFGSVDRVRARVIHRAMAVGSQTLHVMTLTNGGTVKELTNARGIVYALSWRGPGKPDLRQLLGPHFDELQAAAAQRPARWMRIPARVRSSTLVIETGGHPGAFWGVAYLPQSLPPGFSISALM
ncbi:MAG: DUF2844 domain-containing protein [Alphaproteobacteria bacterium]|nr:DUF2844 domain-containing protein [Alphaproteobacteria bacterium]